MVSSVKYLCGPIYQVNSVATIFDTRIDTSFSIQEDRSKGCIFSPRDQCEEGNSQKCWDRTTKSPKLERKQNKRFRQSHQGIWLQNNTATFKWSQYLLQEPTTAATDAKIEEFMSLDQDQIMPTKYYRLTPFTKTRMINADYAKRGWRLSTTIVWSWTKLTVVECKYRHDNVAKNKRSHQCLAHMYVCT